MKRGESDHHGAGPQGAGPGAEAPSDATLGAGGPGPGDAAARYLDLWDHNQSEVSRLGPQILPGFPASRFGL